MTEENIRKMVEKYEIRDNRDGRIRAYHVKTDEEKKQIGEHKAEILAYLKREEEKKKEEYLRKTSFFESIPGVKEIRKALPLMQQELRNWRSSIRKRCSHWIWNIKKAVPIMSWLALPKRLITPYAMEKPGRQSKSSTIKIMTNLYYVMYGIDYRRTGYDEVRKLQILLLRFFGRDFGMRTV